MLLNELAEDWFNEGLQVDFADYHASSRLETPLAALVECDFLSVNRQNDIVTMRLAVKELGNSSLKLRITITRATGDERALALLTNVQVSLDTRRGAPFTSDIRAHIERFLARRRVSRTCGSAPLERSSALPLT